MKGKVHIYETRKERATSLYSSVRRFNLHTIAFISSVFLLSLRANATLICFAKYLLMTLFFIIFIYTRIFYLFKKYYHSHLSFDVDPSNTTFFLNELPLLIFHILQWKKNISLHAEAAFLTIEHARFLSIYTITSSTELQSTLPLCNINLSIFTIDNHHQ